MQPTLGQNQLLHLLRRPLWKLMWSVTACSQPRQTGSRVPRQMFVAGLTADAKLFAQFGEGIPVALRQHDESYDLFHLSDLVPGHSLKVSPITPVQVLPITPDRTGSDRKNGKTRVTPSG